MFGGGMPFTQGGGSPEKPQNQKRADDRTNFLPVTIRMLDTASEAAKTGDGEVRFHGSEASPGMLTVLVQIETVHANSGSMAEFTVCDGTGRIRAKIYAAEGEQEKIVSGLTAGMWVRFLGHFRSAPSPHLSVAVVRLLESADEISHHTIEVVHAALKCHQHNGIRFEAASTPPPKTVRPSADVDVPMGEPSTPEKPKTQERRDMEVDEELTQKLPGTAPVPAVEGAALRSAMLGLLQDLKAGGDEVGLTLQQILEAVEKKGAPVADGLKAVSQTMDTLVDEGETFTTIDDDHFGIL